MKTRFNKLITLGLVAMLAAFTTGCSDDDDTPTNVNNDMGNGAMVRVIHASPDAPAVDIYAEGVTKPLVTNVAYGTTTAYLNIAPGTYNIQLRAAGSDPTSQPAYETGDLAIPKGAKITAVAMGLISSADAADQFRVIPYVENFSAPGAGNAAVRIIHASADAPTVALDVGNDGTTEISNFGRFDDSGEAGVPLPAGVELQIAVWAGSPLQRVTVFTTPQLPEGIELFVIATGLLSELPRDADGFSLLAVGPGGTIGFIKQNPVVFALHGSPDAPAVDIFAGGAELVDNLAFGQLSGAVQVPPGSYDLDFRVHDNGAVAATKATPVLSAGERYLAVASGFVGGGTPAFELLPYDESFVVSGGDARVRVIHASPDAPRVDVGTVAGNVLTPIPAFTDLGFKDASSGGGQSLPAAVLSVGVAQTGTTLPVATFGITTSPGLRAYAVAAGSLSGTGETFRLILVDTSVFPWAAAEVLPD
ncbi:MAG: DUF4397 domain-containing protein [bacterium]